MSELINSDLIKIKILHFLIEVGDDEISPSKIANELKIKYETVKNALIFLEKILFVKKKKETHGKKFYEYYSLTEIGENITNKLRERI